MPFTYDPATPRGRVRLQIADTDAAAFVFDDAEVDAFLAQADGDVLRASALAAFSVSADRGRQARVVAAGNLRLDRDEVAAHYRALGRQLLGLAPVGESSAVE